MTQTLITLNHIQKSFRQGGENIHVLRDINLSLAKGTMTALLGPSGAGKSTLLHIVGLLESPSHGNMTIDGHSIVSFDDGARTALRRHFFGFVYQYHHLLSEFSALENVMLPSLLCGVSHTTAQKRATDILTQLNCSHRLHHMPAQLSGGEQQRVALARALCHEPTVLIADEPTGNLDGDTAATVFDVLLHHVKRHQLTVLVATHNKELAHQCDHLYQLQKGQLTQSA